MTACHACLTPTPHTSPLGLCAKCDQIGKPMQTITRDAAVQIAKDLGVTVDDSEDMAIIVDFFLEGDGHVTVQRKSNGYKVERIAKFAKPREKGWYEMTLKHLKTVTAYWWDGKHWRSFPDADLRLDVHEDDYTIRRLVVSE